MDIDIYFIVGVGMIMAFVLWLIRESDKLDREKREKYRKQLEEQERLVLDPKERKKRDQEEQK